jgi:hypothetical protein
LGRAISLASSGSVIVLRGGTYHEDAEVPANKSLTIESYPHEAVWMDGSSAVTGWVAQSGHWVRAGWTTHFDDSPTFIRGTADGTSYGQFVNPAHPMAAYPDQVWINGRSQKQVGSAAAVAPGSFYVDQANDQLVLGSNPAGKSIRAATLNLALTVRSPHTTVAGIGFRDYAPSVPDMGAVRLLGDGDQGTDLDVTGMSTTGIFLTGNGLTLSHVTIKFCGLVGLYASEANNLTLNGVTANRNNSEDFNQSPVSGGAKIGRSRGITVRGSRFSANNGPGLWFDESVYDASVTASNLNGDAGHGLIFEISSKATVVDDRFIGDGFGDAGEALKINDTSNVTVWNNTFANNNRNIEILQDSRIASNQAVPGHNPARAFPDPTMTWLVGPVSLGDNIVAAPRAGTQCLLCVQDYTESRSAAQIAVTANGDLYGAAATSEQFVWSSEGGNPAVYSSQTAFSKATGQERSGHQTTQPLVNAVGHPTAGAERLQSQVAQQLPHSVTTLLGISAKTRQLGAFVK